MYQWSKIRDKLENEYLADSLKGRIRYFATAYRESHDGDKSRAAIYLDGKPIISGSTFEECAKPDHSYAYEYCGPEDDDLKNGWFDQYDFYFSFEEYGNQSIEASLNSQNQLVRIFAVLDRRTGKRTLYKLKERIDTESEIFRLFYAIRMDAEGININDVMVIGGTL